MSIPLEAADFFVAGGTLRATSPSYVERPADETLFNLVRKGEFCYVLTSRQMGKSSLMVRTAKRLRRHGVRPAILDLTKIGTEVSAEQWYLGLIRQLNSRLRLKMEPNQWWQAHASLGVVERFSHFLHHVVLSEIKQPIVIFIDEIDTTLNLAFSDDFFAVIRYFYNARATDAITYRLTFVLLGVATPTDLIKNRTRTPFNVGHAIELHEFSHQDAQLLQEGLEIAYPEQSSLIFERIFHWTNGHPYLTQKLCLEAVEAAQSDWSHEQVDQLVAQFFLSQKARKETNLQYMHDNVLASPQQQQLLKLYRNVYRGKSVPEDEQSLAQNRLKLYGLLRVHNGQLEVRNQIYRHVFDQKWIKSHINVDWKHRIIVFLSLLVLILAGVAGYTVYQTEQNQQAILADVLIETFEETESVDVRLTSLAGLFKLPDSTDLVWALFNKLSPEYQLALFTSDNSQTVGSQLIIVVKGLYTRLENQPHHNHLLEVMSKALEKVEATEAEPLVREIEQWREGREHYEKKEYQDAIASLSEAIGVNNQNPGTYFDRALAYAAQENSQRAVEDLKKAWEIDQQHWENLLSALPNHAPRLYNAVLAENDAALLPLVPIPTPTPPPTNTPLQTAIAIPSTHTATPLPSFTPTQTATLPAFPTASHTFTPSPYTPIATDSPIVPTDTPTATDSPIAPSHTPTATDTPMPPTHTLTPSPYPQPITPSPTPSEQREAEASTLPSETPSPTPSLSPTLTPSITPTQPITPSPTPSEQREVEASTLPSQTPSLTPTLLPPSPTETPSLPPSETPTLSYPTPDD